MADTKPATGADSIDYRVTLSFDVTAETFELAAANGIDDMRDALTGKLAGCTVEVMHLESGETVTVEIGTGEIER